MRLKILRLTKQHKIQRTSWAKEYIEKYPNQAIIWQMKNAFVPDRYFKAWLGKDDSYQVCKDIFCSRVHIWAAFVKDHIIGSYVLEKKATFTSKKYSFYFIFFTSF